MGQFKDWLLLIFAQDWLNIILTLTALAALGLLMLWQLRPGDGFDLRAMLASRTLRAGQADYWTVEPGRVFQTGAFMLTSWAFVWVVTHDKLTELFLLLYVALWAGSRAMNQVIASKFPAQPGTVIAPEPEPKP